MSSICEKELRRLRPEDVPLGGRRGRAFVKPIGTSGHSLQLMPIAPMGFTKARRWTKDALRNPLSDS
jgi:hypothetical protein